MSKDCCVILRGDVYLGAPMLTDGTGYEDSFGWGDYWGISWGGFQQPMQPSGLAALPASRYVGNANLSWTPNYKDISTPVRFSMSSYDTCQTRVLESITLTLELYCSNAKNQQLEFGTGSESSVAATTITDEIIYAIPGSVLTSEMLLPFAYSPWDSTKTCVISRKNTQTGVLTALVYGTDYEYSMFGIKLRKTLTTAENEVIVASYTSLPSTVADGYSDCPVECSLTIDAKNLADTCGSSAQNYQGTTGLFFPRVKLWPTGQRTLFSDSEFQKITLEGTANPVWLNGREVRLRKYGI